MPPDFTFLGNRLDPKANIRLNRAILFTYGHTTNPRNTESHWYAVWDRVLADITADSARLLPVPQFVLWYIKSNPTDRDDSQDAGGDEEAGNTTIDSITTVASTIPQKSARELVPDFVIVRTMIRRSATSPKLKYAGVPLLAEVKRLPRRVKDLNDPKFLRELRQRVLFAEFDVMDQAAYLFQNYPRQKTVILIACSGTWWRCRIVHKDDVADPSTIMPPIPDYDEEVESDAEEDSPDDKEDKGDTSDDELDIIDAPESLARGESEETIPEHQFSTILQLGTRASDQRFGLIHRRLKAVLDERTGEMG